MLSQLTLSQVTALVAGSVFTALTLGSKLPAVPEPVAYREHPIQVEEWFDWPLPVTGEFQVRQPAADQDVVNSVETHGALLRTVKLAGVDVFIVGLHPEADKKCEEIEKNTGFGILGAALAPSATGGKPMLLLCSTEVAVLETIRHESAHIAQWCHGGKAQYGMVPIGLEQEQMAASSWAYGNFTYSWSENEAQALAEAEADSIGVLWSAAEVIGLVATECGIE